MCMYMNICIHITFYRRSYILFHQYKVAHTQKELSDLFAEPPSFVELN